MRAGRGVMLVLVLALAALPQVACSDSDEPAPPALAMLVPADAHVYAETTLRMDGEDARPARRFVRRLTGREVPDDAILRMIGDFFEVDLPSRAELAPWLGGRGALFMVERRGEVAGGLVLDTTDAEAAVRFLRREVAGPSNDAVVRTISGRVVVGMPEAVRAAANARRASLARTRRYREVSAGGRPFAMLLADMATARADLLAGFPLPPAGGLLSRLARERSLGVRLELGERQGLLRVYYGRSGDPPEPVANLPGDAWLAVSTGNVGALLRSPVGAAFGSRLSLARILASFTGARLPPSLLRQLGPGTLWFQGQHADAGGELRAQVRNRRAADRGMLRYAAALRRSSGKTVEVFRSLRADPGIFTHQPGEESEGEPLSETFLNGRAFSLVFGPIGSANLLEDSPLYREAERALGEPPTTLVDARRWLELVSPGIADERGLELFAVGQSRHGARSRWSALMRLEKRP